MESPNPFGSLFIDETTSGSNNNDEEPVEDLVPLKFLNKEKEQF
jgi:hypothetical protein